MTCLEEVCKKNGFYFQINILGNTYCSLYMQRKKIHCSYLQEKQDPNGFCPCTLNEEDLKVFLNTLKERKDENGVYAYKSDDKVVISNLN